MLSENIFYFGAVFGGDFFKRPLLRSRTSFTPLRRSHRKNNNKRRNIIIKIGFVINFINLLDF